jgi:hypothetical protein
VPCRQAAARGEFKVGRDGGDGRRLGGLGMVAERNYLPGARPREGVGVAAMLWQAEVPASGHRRVTGSVATGSGHIWTASAG